MASLVLYKHQYDGSSAYFALVLFLSASCNDSVSVRDPATVGHCRAV
jgi:hypothetical protein